MTYEHDPLGGHPDFSAMFHANNSGQQFVDLINRATWQMCVGDTGRICVISAYPDKDEIFELASIVKDANTIDIRRKLKGVDIPTLSEARAETKAYWDETEREGNPQSLRRPSHLADNDDLPF